MLEFLNEAEITGQTGAGWTTVLLSPAAAAQGGRLEIEYTVKVAYSDRLQRWATNESSGRRSVVKCSHAYGNRKTAGYRRPSRTSR